ncbi:unnamed protein product [Didymodactylos carnosus]|uniref:C2H2-type domain-containing protein n=1 Tax=Didymodactylos carnosus TaxID=1234261 RepID=A0A8S2DG02_9BILA|nr:unnamed protein product [Didymodactylos carnosus]CAF3706827.1 unnamed protein product [Didymodactylos carnosus]
MLTVSIYPHQHFEELRKERDETIWNANKVSSYNALSRHCSSSGSESENRHHPCTECGKTFATSSGLKQHMHIHSSVKPFQCEVCFKAYTQFSNLCRHKRMHADCRTQVKCRFCGQTFSNSAALNKHRRFCGDVSSYPNETQKSSLLNKEQLNNWLWNSSNLPYSLMPYLPRFATFTPVAPNTCTTIPYFNTFLTNNNTHSSPLSSSSSITTSDETMKTKYNKNNNGYCSIKTNLTQNNVIDDIRSTTNSPEMQLKDTVLSTKVNNHYPTSIKRTLEIEDNDDGPLDLSVKKSKMFYLKNNHMKEHHQRHVSSSPSPSKSPSPALNTKSITSHSSSIEETKLETDINQIIRSRHNTDASSCRSVSTSEQRRNPITVSKYNVESLLNKKCTTSSCENDKIKSISPKSPLSTTPIINTTTSSSPLNLEVLKRIYHANNVFSNPTTSTVAAAAFSQLTLSRNLSMNYDSWQSNTLNKLNYLNTRTNKDKYTCQYCGKVFPRSANLTRHLRTHTGEQPYRCKYCERSFSISSNLQRHIRNIHNREKPFLCTLCDRRFAQQTNLERHLKKHENGLPFDSCSGEEDNEMPSMITTNGNGSLSNHHVELYEQHTLNSEPSSTRRSSSLSLSDEDCSRTEEEEDVVGNHGRESRYLDGITTIENDEREAEHDISSN